VLKLELVVLGFAAIGLHNIVHVVNLRVIHLVVGFCLLDALADLTGRSAVTTDASYIVVCRPSLRFIFLNLAFRETRSVLVKCCSDLLIGGLLVALLEELLAYVFEGSGFKLAFLTQPRSITTIYLIQELGCWFRRRLT
jgi:hypothetical protein